MSVHAYHVPMDTFVSHESALVIWRRLAAFVRDPATMRRLGRERAGVGDLRRCRPDEYAAAFVSSVPHLHDLSQVSWLFGDARLDVLVPSRGARRVIKGARCHSWPWPLPRGAFCPLVDHVYVSSPEFLFMQLAGRGSLERALCLGYELAGTYARDRDVSGGMRPRGTISSVAAMRASVAEGGPFLGAKPVSQALGHVLDGSASPMETMLAILLTLPADLGGYGLPTPELNAAVEVMGPQAPKVLHVDALYRDGGLALEYEGGGHATKTQLERDSIRRAELASAGIEVMTVTRPQVYEVARMDEVARHVAARLGTSFPSGDPDAGVRKMLMRTELLHPQGNPLY